MRALAVALGLLAGVATLATAQHPNRCQIELISVGHEGQRQELFGNNSVLDAGGRVHLSCRAQRYVNLYGDTLNAITGDLYQVIGGHGVRARYVDSEYTIIADTLVYTNSNEELRALGRVLITDLKAGSTLRGDQVEYFRAVKGVRDEALVNALKRPTVRYFTGTVRGDTAHQAPYTITADQLHGFGQSRLTAYGTVVIDRDSLHGRGDSLWFVSGKAGVAQLFGKTATLQRTSADSFEVFGKQIRLDLEADKLRDIHALGNGRVSRGQSDVVADTVFMTFADEKLSLTLAWDKIKHARVHNTGYDITADSIAIDTPGEKPRELRVFRNGRIESPVDSLHRALARTSDSLAHDTTSSGLPDRDTLWGNRIIARFVQIDSAGTSLTRVKEIEAVGQARSFSGTLVSNGGKPSPSINYTRADTIVVTMRTGDSSGVSVVRANGHVDGDQLETASLKPSAPDSTAKKSAADSTRKKTAADSAAKAKKAGGHP